MPLRKGYRFSAPARLDRLRPRRSVDVGAEGLRISDLSSERRSGEAVVYRLGDILGSNSEMHALIDVKKWSAVMPVARAIAATKAVHRVSIGTFSQARTDATAQKIFSLTGEQACTALGPAMLAKLAARALVHPAWAVGRPGPHRPAALPACHRAIHRRGALRRAGRLSVDRQQRQRDEPHPGYGRRWRHDRFPQPASEDTGEPIRQKLTASGRARSDLTWATFCVRSLPQVADLLVHCLRSLKLRTNLPPSRGF